MSQKRRHSRREWEPMPPKGPQRIMLEHLPHAEVRALLDAQKVPHWHEAYVCPVCGTVQSGASLVLRALIPESAASKVVSLVCEGVYNHAGPWPEPEDTSEAANLRRRVRGCDWKWDGPIRVHTLAWVNDKGHAQPMMRPATPEQAVDLMLSVAPA